MPTFCTGRTKRPNGCCFLHALGPEEDRMRGKHVISLFGNHKWDKRSKQIEDQKETRGIPYATKDSAKNKLVTWKNSSSLSNLSPWWHSWQPPKESDGLSRTADASFGMHQISWFCAAEAATRTAKELHCGAAFQTCGHALSISYCILSLAIYFSQKQHK